MALRKAESTSGGKRRAGPRAAGGLHFEAGDLGDSDAWEGSVESPRQIKQRAPDHSKYSFVAAARAAQVTATAVAKRDRPRSGSSISLPAARPADPGYWTRPAGTPAAAHPDKADRKGPSLPGRWN